MSKLQFYKVIKIIKWCTICGKEWRPIRYDWLNDRCICQSCVAKEIAEWRKAHRSQWNSIIARYKKKARSKRLPWVLNEYRRWKAWVALHPERRRAIALNSYYRRLNDRDKQSLGK